MKAVALEHVSITAPEELMEEVLGWYEDCLGLNRIDKPPGTREGGGWFRAGGSQVHVTLDEHNPPKKAHFGLVFDDFSDVLERLRAAGCHIEQAAAIPGRKRFYTRDPAGNRIEIITMEGT
ncbi:MAG: VOC family protein [Actinomycetota bacterium]|nr:VOC family protein [Actinomycetota bacterium]